MMLHILLYCCLTMVQALVVGSFGDSGSAIFLFVAIAFILGTFCCA